MRQGSRASRQGSRASRRGGRFLAALLAAAIPFASSSAAIEARPLGEEETARRWEAKVERSSETTKNVFEKIEFRPRAPVATDPWSAIRAFGKLRSGTDRLNVVFALDRSGSMDGRPYDLARNALKVFMNTLREDDRFALVTFSDDAELVHSYTQGTPDQRMTAAANLDRTGTGGGTNMGGAMLRSIPLLPTTAPNSLLVLLTDGNAQDMHNVNQAIALCKQRGISVIAVGFGDGVKTDELMNIAFQTGGQYYPSSEFDVQHTYARAAASARGSSDLSVQRSTIRQGEMHPFEFDVPAGAVSATYVIDWEGSDVAAVVKNPDGSDALRDICITKLNHQIKIEHAFPPEGRMTVEAEGVNIPARGERLNFSAMARLPIQYTLMEGQSFYRGGEKAIFAVRIRNAVPRKVYMKIFGSDQEYVMNDDGQGRDGDLLANDGVWTWGFMVPASVVPELRPYKIVIETDEEDYQIRGNLQFGTDDEVRERGLKLWYSDEEIKRMKAAAVMGFIFGAISQGKFDPSAFMSTMGTFYQLDQKKESKVRKELDEF